MEKQKPTVLMNPLSIYGVFAFALIGLNIVFLVLGVNITKTVSLLKKEASALEQDEKIITSSQDLYETYRREIELVTGVFPDEETIPEFIQALEGQIRQYADEYSVKFVSLNPLTEQDKLFLLLTVNMKTDTGKLIALLDTLEKFPYMTHVTSLSAKTPEGFSGKSDVVLGLKIYVKNPFSAK